MNHQQILAPAGRQAGFTLLEILVAVLVLSIGLLGFAALQATSINNNQESYLQSQALAIADDLASRMRANRDYVNWLHTDQTNYYKTGSNDASVAATDDSGANNARTRNVYATATAANLVTTAPNPSSCTSANCTPVQLARVDTYEVALSAQRLLPNGVVRTRCFAAALKDRPNPYKGASSPYFNTRSGVGVTGQGPDIITVAGQTAAADTCPPGSTYEIQVFWQTMARRADSGETAFTNRACNGGAAGTDCVSINIIP